MSRSIVRVLTSYRPASCRADRGRGATARNSSTSAYSRSVRFTLAHATPAYRQSGPSVPDGALATRQAPAATACRPVRPLCNRRGELASLGGGEGQPPGDRRAAAGSGPDVELAAERGEPVGHVPQAGSHRGVARVVAGSVVGRAEAQRSV